MGFLSSIFKPVTKVVGAVLGGGGSSQSSTQQAENNVNVDNKAIGDALEVIAKAMENGDTRHAEAIVTQAQLQAKSEENTRFLIAQIYDRISGFFGFSITLVGGYFFYKWLNK